MVSLCLKINCFLRAVTFESHFCFSRKTLNFFCPQAQLKIHLRHKKCTHSVFTENNTIRSDILNFSSTVLVINLKTAAKNQCKLFVCWSLFWKLSNGCWEKENCQLFLSHNFSHQSLDLFALQSLASNLGSAWLHWPLWPRPPLISRSPMVLSGLGCLDWFDVS